MNTSDPFPSWLRDRAAAAAARTAAHRAAVDAAAEINARDAYRAALAYHAARPESIAADILRAELAPMTREDDPR